MSHGFVTNYKYLVNSVLVDCVCPRASNRVGLILTGAFEAMLSITLLLFKRYDAML